MAQRSKLLAAPRQKQFWAPQEGLRSKFKSFCPCQKSTCHFCGGCFCFGKKGLEPARVCALRKQFCKLFLAQSARRVLKFKEFRSPSGKKLLCNFGQVLLPLPKRNSHRFGDCFFFVRQNLSEARACRASSPSAAGGRCSEARMAQRSKYGVTPPYFGHRKRGCEATSSPSAPAKKKDIAFAVSFFFVCSKTCASRHAERAGHRRRSAAGGGYSEAVMAQRSKLLAAPRQKQFWAPQEGLRSKFKSLKPQQKKNRKCRCVLCHEQKTPINFV